MLAQTLRDWSKVILTCVESVASLIIIVKKNIKEEIGPLPVKNLILKFSVS